METQIHLFRYFYKGSWWSLEIPAESKEEALERVQHITLAKYDGVLEIEIPIPPTN